MKKCKKELTKKQIRKILEDRVKEATKREIDAAIKKMVEEHGEILRKLAKE